jgi:transcriptional regulator with XRE-family HTH domain
VVVPVSLTKHRKFGDLLRAEMERAGLSGIEMAAALKREEPRSPTRSAISKWCKGHTVPREHTVSTLAKVLGWDDGTCFFIHGLIADQRKGQGDPGPRPTATSPVARDINGSRQ